MEKRYSITDHITESEKQLATRGTLTLPGTESRPQYPAYAYGEKRTYKKAGIIPVAVVLLAIIGYNVHESRSKDQNALQAAFGPAKAEAVQQPQQAEGLVGNLDAVREALAQEETDGIENIPQGCPIVIEEDEVIQVTNTHGYNAFDLSVGLKDNPSASRPDLTRGKPVKATFNAEIVRAEYDTTGGLRVVLRGVAGNEVWETYSGHMDDIYFNDRFVSPKDYPTLIGKKVTKGTQIGVVGNTGHSTGPHVHYEVRKYLADGTLWNVNAMEEKYSLTDCSDN